MECKTYEIWLTNAQCNGTNTTPAAEWMPVSTAESQRALCELREHRFVQAEQTQYLEPLARVKLRSASASQGGYTPRSPAKTNQDALCKEHWPSRWCGSSYDGLLLGVFDGHGQNGALASAAARDGALAGVHNWADIREHHDLLQHAVRHACASVEAVHANSASLQLSGTTLLLTLIDESYVTTANVGDSRAIMGRRPRCVTNMHSMRWLAVEISDDHAPTRADERYRIQSMFPDVIFMSSIERNQGFNESVVRNSATLDEDPLRVYQRGSKLPATAFTRSLGDYSAKACGVSDTPEVKSFELTQNDVCIIVASDGIFAFLSNDEVLKVAQNNFGNCQDACDALIERACKYALMYDSHTDDIAVHVLFIERTPKAERASCLWEVIRAMHTAWRNRRRRIRVLQEVVLCMMHENMRESPAALGRACKPTRLAIETLYPEFDWECPRLGRTLSKYLHEIHDPSRHIGTGV